MENMNLFVDHPECLQSRDKLKNILADFFPEEKRKIHTVLAAYDEGIVDLMVRAPALDGVLVGRLAKVLSMDYGFEEIAAREAIEFWFVYYGMVILHKSIDFDFQEHGTETKKKKPKTKKTNSVKRKTENPLSDVYKILGIPLQKGNVKRAEKNGFDPTTNMVYILSGYSLEIPEYWKDEQKIEGGFLRYAETGSKTVMLHVAAGLETDESYPVNFDGMMADNENMIASIERTLFKKVTSYEVIDTGIIKGVLYKGQIKEVKGITGLGEWFAFPSEKERSWCTLILGQSEYADFSYINDFMKIIHSIKPVEDILNGSTAWDKDRN